MSMMFSERWLSPIELHRALAWCHLRMKTVLQYRKTKAVGSGYFYILAIKEYKK
jgi:hypothetical protein